MRKPNRSIVGSILALALPALLPVAASAQTTTTAPLPPALGATAPATPPAGKILVLPFVATNPSDVNPWIGKSVQESLTADLTAAAPGRVVTSDQTAPTTEAAIALARQTGARYIVAGGFVTAGQDLRITGQVLDAETGQPITGLKVTGEPGQIFRMEDGLAMQVRGGLMPGQGDGGQLQAQQPGALTQAQAPTARYQPMQPSDATGVRTDYGATNPVTYSTTYATAPAPVSYGSDATNAVYYPAPTTNYYSYTTYETPYVYSYPSWGYGYCSPFSTFCGPTFGLSIGFGYGGGWHSNGHFYDNCYRGGYYNHSYDHGFYGGAGRYNGYGQARTSLGSLNIAAGVNDRGVRGGYSPAVYGSRSAYGVSPAFHPGAFSGSATPYRSPSFVGHSFASTGFRSAASRSFGGASFGRSGGGGFSAGRSIGGGGGHIGGGGGARGGGGHR